MRSVTDNELMPCLASLVGPSRVFLDKHWDQEPWVSTGPPDRFDGLFSLAELDRILSMGALGGRWLKIVRHGAKVPPRFFTRNTWTFGSQDTEAVPDCRRIADLVAKGCTIQAQEVDRVSAPLAQLCASLETELSHRAWANAFLTPPQEQGLNVHSDKCGVIAIQIQGSKRWDIYRRRHATPRQIPISLDPGEQPVLSAVLSQGDAIYVPPGYAHDVKSLDEPSLHLSIGFVHAMLTDFLQEAVEWCAESAGLNVSLGPAFSHDTPEAVEQIRNASLEVSRLLQDDIRMAEAFSAFCSAWASKRRYDDGGHLSDLF